MSAELSHNSINDRRGIGFALLAMILTAMAAGMGWGIRGQYGHETGAMLAGALAGFTLILLFVPNASSLAAARGVAMMTVGIGIGGSMTYGSTIGLTHDPQLLGNVAALRWGLFGLFIKGGIWIGFAGAFLGMGLGGKRYRPGEIALLMAALLGIMFLGIWLLNSPYDPENKILPRIYFSHDWYWDPDGDIKPRREVWGGLLLAWAALTFYVGIIRRDRLGFSMALIGFIAGSLGFSGAQCIQAFPAWHPEVFSEGNSAEFFSHVNWWNMMETTFGAIFGAILALGLWCNRRHIAIEQAHDEVVISPPWEILFCVVHLVLMMTAEFLLLPGRWNLVQIYILYGLLLATLPMIGVVGGRLWPYLLPLPIVAAPILGKTVRQLAYKSEEILPELGWLVYGEIPIAVMICAAVFLIAAGIKGQSSRQFARVGLLLTTWLFFGVNYAFFLFPWPWADWTGRTFHGTIFAVCALCLTVTALVVRPSKEAPQ